MQQLDPRFCHHPAVTGENHIRFMRAYLEDAGGICNRNRMCDHRKPESFGRDSVLQELAGAAMDRIELQQSAATDSLTGASRGVPSNGCRHLVSLALRHQIGLSCIVSTSTISSR